MVVAFEIVTPERKIISRIRERLEKTLIKANSAQEKMMLLRIGLLVTNQAKINIRRNKQVDSGALLNSISPEISKTSNGWDIDISPRGIPYAAINEFGRVFTARQRRAMFRSLRDSGKLNNNKDKNVIIGGKNSKIYRARPYLRPALLSSRTKIIDILRDYLGGKP